MKIAWVLGWAVPAEWFAGEVARAWPEAEHRCVPAAPDWRERLAALGRVDALGGYSLGSLLLLSEPFAFDGPVGLLAPIWAFPSEAGRGGRVTRAQVRALARWVRRDEAAARADFYARAGLGGVAGAVEPAETLLWGLEQLETRAAPPGLPTGWRGFVGAQDPLLEAASAEACVVPGAGHAPGPLIAAWREEARRA